jgi:hypothetical protein
MNFIKNTIQLPHNIILPDNVHKCIAGFLQLTEINCNIKIYMNAGCPENYHSFEESENCENCKNIYRDTKIYFALKKGGSNRLYNLYIDTIKKKISDNKELKLDYSNWYQFREIGPPWFINDLFEENKKKFYGPVKLFEWEHEYKKKYVLNGLHYSLFYSLKDELHPIPGFYISRTLRGESTIRTSCMIYDVIGKKYINKYSCINKLYNKYCKKKIQ